MNIEDAFIQLFERKGRIGDQIRQQVHSHAETLSVNFEASGRGDPPQFQWNNGTAAASDFSFPAGSAYQFGYSGVLYSACRDYRLQTTMSKRDNGSMNFFGPGDLRRFSHGRALELQTTFMRAPRSVKFLGESDCRRFSLDRDFVHQKPSSSYMIEHTSMNLSFPDDGRRQEFPMDRVPEDVNLEVELGDMDQNMGSDLQKSGLDMRNSENFMNKSEVEGHCPSQDGKSISNIDQLVRSRVFTENKSGLENGAENSYPSKNGKEFVNADDMESLKDSFEKRLRNSFIEIGRERKPSKEKKVKDSCTCNGLNLPRSSASSMKLRSGKNLLSYGYQSINSGLPIRSKDLSGKLDLDDSSKGKNVDVFEVGQFISVENLLTEKGTNKYQNSEKLNCHNESLKDTDYIGWVTRSKTSLAKLDQENESTKEKNVDVCPDGYEKIEEDINIGKGAVDAYGKDLEDVNTKLSHELEHVFTNVLNEGSSKTIVQTGGSGLEHATLSDSPSVNIREKHTVVDIENNNLLEANNRKKSSTPIKYPESKKHFFINPTVCSTTPLLEYLEIIPSEKDSMPFNADELKTSNGHKEVHTIASERRYFSGSSTSNDLKIMSESNRTPTSACDPNKIWLGRNKSEVKDSTTSLSEYLEIIPSVKDGMPLDVYGLETSGGPEYEVVDGFVEKISVHGNLCNPSGQAQNSSRSFTCNVNSSSHIFPERQEAMVINGSGGIPLKHDLCLKTTIKTDDNHKTTGDHTFAKDCLYFDRKEVSAESNRTSKPSEDVPFAGNYEMNKREVRESLDNIYGTSYRPRLNSFLGSNQCEHKISSVDTEPIMEFHDSLLSKVANDDNMELHNSMLSYTSPIKYSGDIQQMKLQVSKVVPESNDKKQERLSYVPDTVPEHRNPHASNNGPHLIFCKPASEFEYSASSGHKEATENRISRGSFSTLQHGCASITTQIVHEISRTEKDGINGITGGVYNSKEHHDSVADLDLLCGHIPKNISSVLSGHSCAAQSRLSLNESNFSPCIGAAPTIMQTVVSPMEREEVENAVSGNNNVVININNNDKPEYSELEHKASSGEDDFSSHDLDKLTQTHTVDQFIPVNFSPDFEIFSVGDSDLGNCNMAKSSCYTEPYHLPNISYDSHSMSADHLQSISLGSLDFNDDERNQHSCIDEGNIPLLRESVSEEPILKRFRFSYDNKSPFIFQADSNTSSRRCSTREKRVNLGHICSPIDENACTTGEGVLDESEKNAEEGELEKISKEEDIILNKLEKALKEEEIISKQEKIAQGVLTSELVISGNEKPFGKEASFPITSQMPSTSQTSFDQGSPDSMTTEVNVCMQANEKKSMGDGSKMRCKNMAKKRLAPLSILKNVSRHRSGKSKLSIKSCDEHKNIATNAKSFKPANILSNISSFIPLVQQKKQAAAMQTVKREIKVKALEAAEAVRRNEERKEKERKMKKEASKLEKLRLEQEKVKQREINQKKNDEEQKKEGELNAWKRQREEDQKNGKKKKKLRCLEEKLRQHRLQNKMHAEDKGLQHNATEVNNKLAAKKIQELLPYEMTPFYDSEMEEDNNKNQRIKAIPMWARKESLHKILQSQRDMNPVNIFNQKRHFELK